MSIKKNTTILRNLTISAFREKQKAIVYIELMKHNFRQKKDSGPEAGFILEYLDFLLGLAHAPDNEIYLKGAGEKNVEFMRSLMVNKISDEVTKKYRELTGIALKGGKLAEETIISAKKIFSRHRKSDRYYQYLDFLTGLAQAENKKEYIKNADRKMVEFMHQL